MSRENEKVLAELRKFLELHNEELNDEKDFDRLAEQFLSQHNGSPDGGSMGEIETADDYLELAEQAASKKKRLNYLKKALELEPDHVDAQLQLISLTLEDKLDEQLPALRQLMDAGGGRSGGTAYRPGGSHQKGGQAVGGGRLL